MMSSRTRDYAFVILASVLWGTSFPGSKVTVNTVDPLFLTFARMALGASLGMTVLVVTRRMNARLFRDPMVWLLGAVNAIGFDLHNAGSLLPTASKTALVVDVNAVCIAYLGLVPTFTPLMLYVASMRTISPTISALLILLEVVVAAILSFVFLRDPLDGYTLAGGALILFGAYVVTRGEQPIPEPAAGGLASVPADTAGREADQVARR